MTQAKRLEILRKAIKKRQLSSQAELIRILQDQGIRTTQPSLSRDLQKLGVVKINGVYELPKAMPTREPGGRKVSLQVSGGSIVVVKTQPGYASRIAYHLDEAGLPGVAGTISGDDTIFVAVESEVNPARVLAGVQVLLEQLNA